MPALVEKYRPQRLQDFAGLATARAVLSRFATQPYSSAWLFVGAPGTGKTTLAFALAKEIGGEVHHIPSRNCDLASVEKVCEKCHYYPWVGKWHFVIVDEADQMSRPAQHAFLSKLDATAPPPNTIFLFTANDTALLERRFITRTRMLRIDLTDEAPAAVEFLERVWKSESDREAPDLGRLFTSSEHNLREALMKLEIELVAPGSSEVPAEPIVAARATRPGKAVKNDEKTEARREASRRAWVTIRANRAKARKA